MTNKRIKEYIECCAERYKDDMYDRIKEYIDDTLRTIRLDLPLDISYIDFGGDIGSYDYINIDDCPASNGELVDYYEIRLDVNSPITDIDEHLIEDFYEEVGRDIILDYKDFDKVMSDLQPYFENDDAANTFEEAIRNVLRLRTLQ